MTKLCIKVNKIESEKFTTKIGWPNDPFQKGPKTAL